MHIIYNLPKQDILLKDKIDMVETLKKGSIDHWCERVNFNKMIKSNLPYLVFLSSIKEKDKIRFEMIRDFERELHYGKVIVSFSMKDDYFVYIMDFSLSEFNKIIKKLKLEIS